LKANLHITCHSDKQRELEQKLHNMAWHIVQPHQNKLNLKIKYIKDKVHAESADIPREKYILKGGLNG
jgi:hypothetical protein